MGKVDRLRYQVEPFTALFWALGSVVNKACPFTVMLPEQWWRVASLLSEDVLPHPFSYLGLLFIYAQDFLTMV